MVVFDGRRIGPEKLRLNNINRTIPIHAQTYVVITDQPADDDEHGKSTGLESDGFEPATRSGAFIRIAHAQTLTDPQQRSSMAPAYFTGSNWTASEWMFPLESLPTISTTAGFPGAN